jgi:predicted secreted Zn-dependent protease
VLLALVMGVPVAAQSATARPPAIDFTIRTYELPDERLSDVIARLNEMRLEGDGGPRSQGLTQYYIQPEWSPRASGGTCRVARMQLEVQIVVTLPEWPGVARAPEEERTRWEAILAAIRDHEFAHRDLTIEAAREITEVLSGLEASGCMNLRRAVAGTLSIHGGRLDEAHAKLDAATLDRLVG